MATAASDDGRAAIDRIGIGREGRAARGAGPRFAHEIKSADDFRGREMEVGSRVPGIRCACPIRIRVRSRSTRAAERDVRVVDAGVENRDPDAGAGVAARLHGGGADVRHRFAEVELVLIHGAHADDAIHLLQFTRLTRGDRDDETIERLGHARDLLAAELADAVGHLVLLGHEALHVGLLRGLAEPACVLVSLRKRWAAQRDNVFTCASGRPRRTPARRGGLIDAQPQDCRRTGGDRRDREGRHQGNYTQSKYTHSVPPEESKSVRWQAAHARDFLNGRCNRVRDSIGNAGHRSRGSPAVAETDSIRKRRSLLQSADVSICTTQQFGTR